MLIGQQNGSPDYIKHDKAAYDSHHTRNKLLIEKLDTTPDCRIRAR
jgi:hypothetical protein